MNMFKNEPEGLGGLVGCAFWVVFFAATMAIFFRVVVGLAGFAR